MGRRRRQAVAEAADSGFNAPNQNTVCCKLDLQRTVDSLFCKATPEAAKQIELACEAKGTELQLQPGKVGKKSRRATHSNLNNRSILNWISELCPTCSDEDKQAFQTLWATAKSVASPETNKQAKAEKLAASDPVRQTVLSAKAERRAQKEAARRETKQASQLADSQLALPPRARIQTS